jgi:hypothetical protein
LERDLRDLFCLNANVRVGVSIATFCSLDVDSLVHFSSPNCRSSNANFSMVFLLKFLETMTVCKVERDRQLFE